MHRPLVEFYLDWNTTLLMVATIVVSVIALVILIVIIDRIEAWRINARYWRLQHASNREAQRRDHQQLDQARAALLLAELHMAKMRVKVRMLELEDEPVSSQRIYRSGGQKRLN